MTTSTLLSALEAQADRAKADGKAAYHKADRPYLGIPNPVLNDMATLARRQMDLPTRLVEARLLWDSNGHEARVLAAKLLTQARIRPDAEVWELILTWVPNFDAWAISDHAASAGSRRLVADPRRLDTVEAWLSDENPWVRRAALTFTLPWTKQSHPKPEELAVRHRVLGWAETLIEDRNWFTQKAIAWWLRDLSRRDPAMVQAWLDQHGSRLKAFARKEAGRLL